jgi:hypothetical protein
LLPCCVLLSSVFQFFPIHKHLSKNPLCS